MLQAKISKYIFNFFYQKRYTTFEYLLFPVVMLLMIERQALWAAIIFVLGMFGSIVFQVLVEGVKKY